MDADPQVERAIGPVVDAVNIRRARLQMGGTLYRDVDFYLQFDFENTFNTERTGQPLVCNTPAPTDAWITFKSLPGIGNLRVGNQKAPLCFEHLISSRFLDFMERSLCYDAFVEEGNNGFRMGLQLFDQGRTGRWTWALGVFKNTRNSFGWNTGNGEHDVTGRITYLPWYEEDGRRLLHLGIGGSVRGLDDGQARFRARTLVRNGPAVLHTILADVTVLGNGQELVVPEFALVSGPLAVQAELFEARVKDAVFPATPASQQRSHGDARFGGYYVQALCFLTGEHRFYDRRAGAFGRVTPRRNAAWGPAGSGRSLGGAWALACRHSRVDLDDGAITGGSVDDDSFGVNWFLNPYLKIQWNYCVAHRDGPGEAGDGVVKSFGTRLAVDF